MSDCEKLKKDYIAASWKIRNQKIELSKAYETIEQLKKDNKELKEYKKAYYSLKKAGVDLPHVRGKRSVLFNCSELRNITGFSV